MTWTFSNIKSLLVSKLKEYADWSVEILTTGVYSVLLDVVAFSIEKLAYYADFLFKETTDAAQLTSSNIQHAKFLGYTPKRKIGASGLIILGSDPNFSTLSLTYTGNTVQIPKWKQFQNGDGTTFAYSILDHQFLKNSLQRNKFVDVNSSATQITGSIVGLPCVAHGFLAGEEIKITGTQNYDGIYLVDPSTIPNRIHILATFVAETFRGTEKVSSGYEYIEVKEGRVKEFIYTAIGNVNERIPIYSSNIDNDTIEVWLVDANDVNISQISIVSDLFFVDNIVTYTTEIQNFPDYTGIYVKFGDNITSKQLVTGDRIKIIYAETNGAEGNIETSGIITTPTTPLQDIYGNEVTGIYITNEDPIIGGSNLQSNERIKKFSRALYNSGYQLNNRASWIATLEEVPYIHKAIMYTELDIGDGTLSLIGQLNQNVHYVTAVKTNGEGLSEAEETSIATTYLIPRKSPTDIISWQKLKKVLIRFVVDATIYPQLSFSSTKSQISDALSTAYDVLNMEFAEEIYNSNYINTIDDVSSVIRHTTTAYYADENINNQAILYKAIVNLPVAEEPDATKQIQFVPNSPEIWIRRKINFVWHDALKIATTSAGTVSGVNTFNVSGNTVDATSQITYQCFNVVSNIVPSFVLAGTTTNNSTTVLMASTANVVVGQYVTGLNIQAGTTVKEIVVNTSITLSQPTAASGAGSGNLTFCFFPDAGGSFGTQNPNSAEATGYILYLVYKTQDGNGNRTSDLRLSNFDQIFDYSPELSTINVLHEA